MPDAPKIDSRTAPDIAGQVRDLLGNYTKVPFDAKKGTAAALINIFARYSELIIERLNRVPEKNFLAFLDLLGAAPVPPQPARAPLTFTPSEGSRVETVVPAGTQVAAPAAEGETSPVIFETESELVVTTASLESIFVRDPEYDRSADRSLITSEVSPDGAAVFKLDREAVNTERILYIAHDELFAHPGLNALALTFEIKNAGNVKPLKVSWETWDEQGKMLVTETDISNGGDVTFKHLSPFRPRTVNGLERRWLRGRLKTPIPHAAGGVESRPPEFKQVTIKSATLKRSGLQVERAIANDTPVGTVKSFFPFGERPKTGDALYLAHREAFSGLNANITLHFTVANSPRAAKELVLKYEFWDGNQWSALTSTDTTNSLKNSGDVKFTFTTQPVATTINGVESFWIRVRIAAGGYGEEAHFALIDPNDPSKGFQGVDANLDRKTDGKPDPYYGDPTKGYKLIPATYAPPSIGSLTIDYDVTTPAQPPEVVLTYNDFKYRDETLSSSFVPFKAMPDAYPSLYLGFELPLGRETFPQRKISLYMDLYEYKFDEPPDTMAISRSAAAAASGQPQLDWEYSTGTAWAKLLPRDATEGFMRSGLIEFMGPTDFALSDEFGLERFWIRAVWKAGVYQFAPRLRRRPLLNTIMAAQTVTISNEVLGSSDGSRNQRFRTTQVPVLAGQWLEVRESEKPSVVERKMIEQGSGPHASLAAEGANSSSETWVRWTEVADFYGSGARDRHYIIDRPTGEIRFGDGTSGMIPPVGSGNILMPRYRTGGGAAGNKPAGAITQLKTTVPYIQSANNYLAAAGGADAETLNSLIDRAPRSVRHRDRAVTIEDYEDLAMLASGEVARVRCVPLFNLEKKPLAMSKEERELGTVSLILVPRSSDARPTPTIELIENVRSYLDQRRSPTSKLVIVGPKYVRVSVAVAVALRSMEGASEVELAIARALSGFLHPLTGGWDGAGWNFGSRPHRSALYSLIEAVAGVGHIRSLNVTTPAEDADALQTDRFLVYSGAHTITLSLESVVGSARSSQG